MGIVELRQQKTVLKGLHFIYENFVIGCSFFFCFNSLQPLLYTDCKLETISQWNYNTYPNGDGELSTACMN